LDQVRIPVHPAFADEVQRDSEKASELYHCARSFRHFLNYWHFLNQEGDARTGGEKGGKDQVLGLSLWDSQEQIVEAMENVDKFFNLKARKLGATTLSIAFDGWVARFRDENARVHLFSRRDDAAKELLKAVKYGLDRLPEWMRLPYATKPTQDNLQFAAGPEDLRFVKAYPTSEETAVEATCTHCHLDEWARMKNPESVWQAVEPSVAGSCHIITTGRGPQNFASIFWRQSLAGDNEFVPIFVGALTRSGRDEAWLAAKRRGMTEQAFRQEYPMTWEDALFAGGRFTFASADLDRAGDGRGPTAPVEGRMYVKAWDIGRHQDAAVCTVLDPSEEVAQVVEYIRLRGAPYPTIQARMQTVHSLYQGLTVIEKNAAGEAVAENLVGISEHELELFWTGAASKAKIIEDLLLALENETLRWSGGAWPQLDLEVRSYQIPDDAIVQDSVISLAIANRHREAADVSGRLGRVLTW